MTRERKIYLGVLVVAGLAIAVDKAVLTPTGAAASNLGQSVAEIDSSIGHSTSFHASTASIDMVTSVAKLLARQMLDIDISHAGDAFSASDQWPSTADEPVAETERLDERASAFQEQHKLTSVMMGSRRSGALINGKFLRRGQMLDGFRLVRVEARRVVFAREGQLIVLHMERKGMPSGGVSGRD